MNRILISILITISILFSQCQCKQEGCMDSAACNYDATAEKDDNSCMYGPGCTNPSAINYNPKPPCKGVGEQECHCISCNCEKVFALYVDFWNPSGTNPQISFDSILSDSEVKIDFAQTFGGYAAPNSESKVVISNVRIIDNQGINYKVDSIIAYEERPIGQGGSPIWKLDTEFKLSAELLQDLNVMLVLDASNSLDTDFPKVQNFAKNFVDKIFANTPSVQIGIVDFATNVNSQVLTNNKSILTSYINNINQGGFTALYQAMDTGIDLLQNNQSEGKAIVTFTDGTDNNSSPTFTPDYLVDKLTNDPNSIKVNSFTIGFQGNGGVDKPILEKLAENGGIAAFPNTINELEKIFDDFSKSISNVYKLTYTRNQQPITQNDLVKIRFLICASPK